MSRSLEKWGQSSRLPVVHAKASCVIGRRADPRAAGPFRQGFTILEILVVLAILGIVLVISAIMGRGALTNQEELSAIRSIQQSIWQGASAASARGRNTELIHTGRRVEVREVGTGRLIRTEELPSGVTTTLPNLVFTPPGKISSDSFALVTDGISVNTAKTSTLLRVSIIGEVVAERR